MRHLITVFLIISLTGCSWFKKEGNSGDDEFNGSLEESQEIAAERELSDSFVVLAPQENPNSGDSVASSNDNERPSDDEDFPGYLRLTQEVASEQTLKQQIYVEEPALNGIHSINVLTCLFANVDYAKRVGTQYEIVLNYRACLPAVHDSSSSRGNHTGISRDYTAPLRNELIRAKVDSRILKDRSLQVDVSFKWVAIEGDSAETYVIGMNVVEGISEKNPNGVFSIEWNGANGDLDNKGVLEIGQFNEETNESRLVFAEQGSIAGRFEDSFMVRQYMVGFIKQVGSSVADTEGRFVIENDHHSQDAIYAKDSTTPNLREKYTLVFDKGHIKRDHEIIGDESLSQCYDRQQFTEFSLAYELLDSENKVVNRNYQRVFCKKDEKNTCISQDTLTFDSPEFSNMSYSNGEVLFAPPPGQNPQLDDKEFIFTTASGRLESVEIVAKEKSDLADYSFEIGSKSGSENGGSYTIHYSTEDAGFFAHRSKTRKGSDDVFEYLNPTTSFDFSALADPDQSGTNASVYRMSYIGGRVFYNTASKEAWGRVSTNVTFTQKDNLTLFCLAVCPDPAGGVFADPGTLDEAIRYDYDAVKRELSFDGVPIKPSGSSVSAELLVAQSVLDSLTEVPGDDDYDNIGLVFYRWETFTDVNTVNAVIDEAGEQVTLESGLDIVINYTADKDRNNSDRYAGQTFSIPYKDYFSVPREPDLVQHARILRYRSARGNTLPGGEEYFAWQPVFSIKDGTEMTGKDAFGNLATYKVQSTFVLQRPIAVDQNECGHLSAGEMSFSRVDLGFFLPDGRF
jgi:hypothetical protein